MKVGDLVQIRNRETLYGVLVVMNNVGKNQMWAKVYSMKDGKIYHELVRSLKVVKKCP